MCLWQRTPIHARAYPLFILPERLPPGLTCFGSNRLELRLVTDLIEFPAGEQGEILGLLVTAPRQFLGKITLSRRTTLTALPGMAEDIAPLKIAAIPGLLKGEVFGEMRLVIAQMEAGDKNVLRLDRGGHDLHRRGFGGV